MAEKLNVKLVNGDDLVSMVDELGAEELITQYDIDGTEEMQSQMKSQSIPSRESTIVSAESKNRISCENGAGTRLAQHITQDYWTCVRIPTHCCIVRRYKYRPSQGG